MSISETIFAGPSESVSSVRRRCDTCGLFTSRRGIGEACRFVSTDENRTQAQRGAVLTGRPCEGRIWWWQGGIVQGGWLPRNGGDVL